MHKNLKKHVYLFTSIALISAFTIGCSSNNKEEQDSSNNVVSTATVIPTEEITNSDETIILLSDTGIQINGQIESSNTNNSVSVGDDIVYYEEGHDDTYGEGTTKDSHSAEEAEKHTVITITKPGNYKLTGSLSYGQIAIDLGDNAKEDPKAVVNLVLDDVNINCSVAPAIVVYSAYECGNSDESSATPDVNTANAGFNLVLADNSTNVINGAYVAKIYKEGTTDKLHKYDAAIESKVSFNIAGESLGNGILTINALNEGIESGLHLTINGGDITINSADDAINTNEDNVSVLTINGGTITCDSGNGSEGDGIDSNGYIVINGGYTVASANPQSPDSGIDSDLGIYINGGTLLASGNMYDEISSDSKQSFIVLGFNETKTEQDLLLLKDSDGNPIAAFNAINNYTKLVYSNDDLTDGEYSLYQVSSVTGDLNGSIYTNITDYQDEQQLQYNTSNIGGFGGGMAPNNNESPNLPNSQSTENLEKNETGEKPSGSPMNENEKPQGEKPVDEITDSKAPEEIENFNSINQPDNGNIEGNIQRPDTLGSNSDTTVESSTIFHLSKDSFIFNGIFKVTDAE